MEHIYIPQQDYKVLVSCMTYNQSKYIIETLNGFAMQNTDFPYVCLIMDDCSTDCEQEVIKAWIGQECDMDCVDYIDIEHSKIILVPHKRNHSCFFAFYLLKKNLYREKGLKLKLIAPWRDHCLFYAPCEGDDYWIDPNKLQLQVNALDSFPNCTICINKVRKVDVSGKPLMGTFPEKNAGFKEGIVTTDKFIKEEFYHGRWNFQIAGCMFRMQNLQRAYEHRKTFLSKYPFGDIPTILSHFLDGDGFYIDREMSCYRVMSGHYNLSLAENPQKAIGIHEQVKLAMDDVDKYTGGKYHTAFMHNKLWCDYKNEVLKNKNIDTNRLLIYLKPHFWPLITPRLLISIILSCMPNQIRSWIRRK